jgi:hypothetical protein
MRSCNARRSLYILLTLITGVFFSCSRQVKKNSAAASGTGQLNPGLSIQRFFFEITRYQVSGCSLVPAAPSLAAIAPVAQLISAHVLWTEQFRFPVLVCERYDPSLIGVIEATFCPEDLYAPREVINAEGKALVPDIDWVDKVLMTLPVPDSGTSLLTELDHRSGNGIPESAAEPPPELPADLPRSFENADGELRRFTYGPEQLAVTTDGSTRVIISAADTRMIRKTFDGENRLIQKEVWAAGPSVQSPSLVSLKKYFYRGVELVPVSSTEDIYGQKIQNRVTYDDKGRAAVAQTVQYDTSAPDALSMKPVHETEWQYDSADRILEQQDTDFVYETAVSGRDTVRKAVTKTVWRYSPGRPDPDCDFYEDGQMRMKIVYAASSVYTETLFFDNAVSVVTHYEHGVMKSESIYVNGIEQRRREF